MNPSRFIMGLLGALVLPCGAPAQPPGAGGVSPLASRIAAAAPGDTIEVGPGTYPGRLVIDKAVRLVARPGPDRPVLDAQGYGDAVEIRAENVELRGFIIERTGSELDGENVGVRVLANGAVIQDNELRDVLFGVDCKAALRCVIRNNVIGAKDLDIARRGDAIRLWRSDGTLIEGNTIRDGRDSILWYSKGVIVRNNLAERCRYGFHLMYSNDVTIEGNTLRANSVGIYFMYSTGVTVRNNIIDRNRGPSGYGIGLKDTDAFVIENNILSGNRVGMYLDNSPVVRTNRVLIARNTIAVNDVGMQFLPSVKGNTLTGNTMLDNFEQISVLGRGDLSDNEFDLDGAGNFWGDYAGYDADHDGVGDTEYESQTLFENLMDREPKLRLLMFSPVQQAIEFVGRALPAIRPEPKFSDLYPLMRPAGATLVAPARAGGGNIWIAAAALLGVPSMIVGFAFADRLLARPAARRNCPAMGGATA